MKKIRLVLLFLLVYATGYTQFCEGFDVGAVAAPTPVAENPATFALWTLGSGNWAIINAKGPIAWAREKSPKAVPNTGEYAAYLEKEILVAPNVTEDWLVTPAINLVGMTNAQLKFNSRQTISGVQGSTYKVLISTSSQTSIASFTEKKKWTEAELNPTYNAYNEITLDLSGYTGNIYIAFVMIGGPATTNGGDRWIIDDVYVGSKCIEPLTPSVADITVNSAKLTWLNPGGASQFEVEYMLDSATPTKTGTIVNQNYYTTGAVLLPNTGYKYYVRSKCSSCYGNNSQWIGPFFFSTLRPGEVCELPIVIPPTLPYLKVGEGFRGTGVYNVDIGCGSGTNGSYKNGRTVYSYTPPAGTTSININVIPGSDDPSFSSLGVFVYNSCANVGVNCMASSTDGASKQKDILNLSVTPGVTYYIAVATKFSANGNYSIVVKKNNCTANIAANFSIESDCNVTNEDFYTKVAVTNMGGFTSLVATPFIGATEQTAQKLTITAPGIYTFGPYKFNVKVQVLLQSAQDANCYIISDYLFKKPCKAINDECSTAVVLPTNINGLCNPIAGSLLGATVSPEVNNCTGSNFGDIWYQFTAVANEHFINIDQISDKLSLNHAVYEGNSCGSLTQLYCENGVQSIATNLVIGKVYRIRVFSTMYLPEVATFKICVAALPKTCIDDDPSAINVKGLFINLMNHLLTIDIPLPDATAGYNCPQLIALAPYITVPNPKIYSFTRSNGQLSFSFSSGGTPNVTLSGIPLGQFVTDVKFLSYLNPTAGASMSVVYGNGKAVNSGNSAKLITFCPGDFPCKPIVGNIKITPGLSCMVVGKPYGFSLVTDATNIVSYSWKFYDFSNNLAGTSNLANPVMTFTVEDSYIAELTVKTSDGCTTLVKKLFSVLSECDSFCTETNPQSTVVKNLYIDLVNYLLSTYGAGGDVATITTGFNCPELVALAPYLTDVNPLIYNLSYVSSTKTLRFSFANHGAGGFDISVINNGLISDIDITSFSLTTASTYTTLYVNGSLNEKHSISHVNFCSGLCAPLKGAINLDSGISCVVLNKSTLFNFQTTSSVVTSYAWTFYAVNSTTAVLTTSTLSHPSFTYTGVGSYQVKLVVNYGSGCTATFWKSITVGATCTTCTETNSKSANVKELYLNLVNYLIATGGNVTNPYNCPALEALSPYITDNNPQIWNLTSTGGLLKFSFNNHGTGFDVSVPNTGQIADINLINYSSHINAQTFSTTYVNGTISPSHSIRHIDFCPDSECIPLFGEIELDQGVSCVPLNTQQSFHLQANLDNVVSYAWTFYNELGNISTSSTIANPVLAYNAVGNYLVKLVVTKNTGCTTTFYKTITVSATCGTACTETNVETSNAKALYIALLNRLLSMPTIPNGYSCLELSMLSSYITDANPAIHNPVWNGQVLSFSFSAGDSSPDVVIGKYGVIGDINLFAYAGATVNTNPIVTYTNGTVSKTHTVKHINFCPTIEICQSNVVFVIDESSSIDSMEAEKIKIQLTKFIEQQLAFKTTTTISFIGMSDSDTNTRTDHVHSKVTLDSKQDFDNWIANYKSYYTPERQAKGISANSDYWASGLSEAMTLDPEIIILIADGSQTANVNELKSLIKEVNTSSHLYVYGIGEGHYVDGNTNYGQSVFYSSMETTNQWPVGPLVTYDSVQPYAENYSLKISNSGNWPEVTVHSNVWVSINNAEAREYTFSAWVKTEAVSAEIILFMKTATEAGYYTKIANRISVAKPGWQYIESKFLVPADIKKLNIRLDCNGAGNVWFDDVRIVEKAMTNPNDGQAVSEVTTRLMTSLKYLMDLPSTQFPASGQVDILKSTYFEYPDFNHLESDLTYFSDRLAYAVIGCGGEITPKDFCNDCETFQPYPSSSENPITYWISAWVMEEQNIQVKNYTNAVIHLIFEDGNKNFLGDLPFFTSGDIIDGWQRVASKFQIPKNTSIMRIELENLSEGIPAYFDDIRIHPINGSMKSFVYDPETFRLMAEHDDNNYTTFYEYDKEGGLIRIKKETSKGIKTIQESRSGSVIQPRN